MARLTNFFFEFLYAFFRHDAALVFLFHGAKKSKMTKNSNQGDSAINLVFCRFVFSVILPWPKKLRWARKPNIGACMLDRSRACATCARLSQFFFARVVLHVHHVCMRSDEQVSENGESVA